MLEQQEGTTCHPAWLHEQPSGHCPPHFSRNHFSSSQGLGWMQKLYWRHQYVATLFQTARLHHYNHMSNRSTHCQVGGLSLSPAAGSQSSDTSPLRMSPFLFPSLGNFTAHLHPGHGSDPSPCYPSFMHYNATDWSHEPRHIISVPFTHGCMLWESLAPALSPLGLSWGHPKCSLWGNLLPIASDPQQVLMMAEDLEVKAGVSTGQAGSIWEGASCLLCHSRKRSDICRSGLCRVGSKCFPLRRASGSKDVRAEKSWSSSKYQSLREFSLYIDFLLSFSINQSLQLLYPFLLLFF